MLDNLKILLNISEDDISKDNLLNIYLNEAEDTVRSYCNINEIDILNNALTSAVLKLALFNYKNRGKENITQMSQGSRSITLKSSLPTEIEMLCKPYRRIKVMR